MDTLETADILEEILLRLDQEDVDNLSQISVEYKTLVKKVEKKEEYWRKRLSNYLGFEVFELVGRSWKKCIKKLYKLKKIS